MRDLISKDTGITIGLAMVIAGAIWWAATVQADLGTVKRDVAEIKAVITRNHGVSIR